MSRREVTHPTKPRTVAVVGFDPALSFFVEIRAGGRVVESYDRLAVRDDCTLAGVLRVLVRHGFLTTADIEDGHRLLAHVAPAEILDAGSRRAAEIILALKLGAEET